MLFFSARERADMAAPPCACATTGRKLEIDFERNSERYVEHVSRDTEISRLQNSFSAVPSSNSSSKYHSADKGRVERGY